MAQIKPLQPLAPFAAKLHNMFGLSEQDYSSLVALSAAERVLNPGDYLVRQGESAPAVSVVLAGYLQRHKIVRAGGRQIVAVCLPGDMIGFLCASERRAEDNVQALTRSKVAHIAVPALVSLCHSNPTIFEALALDQLADRSIAHEWTVNIGRRDAMARTAHFLCELGVRQSASGLGRRARYPMPFTQEQLADALGLTAVHTNRTLRKLASYGLIRYGDGWITILDLAELERLGDFDPAYLAEQSAAAGSSEALTERHRALPVA